MPKSERALRVLRVWTSLSASEKNEVVEGIQTLANGTLAEKVLINESIAKGTGISLGPTDGKCPYCGR
jgi:hypothetical protein